MKSYVENVVTAHHIAVVDLGRGVGVGVAEVHEEVPCWSLWQSRADLDIELHVIGAAVVALLDGGRFVVAPAPDGRPLWGLDDLPAYVDGAEAALWHPALADLWPLLEV